MTSHTEMFSSPDLTQPPDFRYRHKTIFNHEALGDDGRDCGETFVFDARCPKCREIVAEEEVAIRKEQA